jgi:hypothetical protein
MTLPELLAYGRDLVGLWPRYQWHQRTALIAFLFLGAYVVYLFTLGRPPSNLVKNGGFEQGTQHWGTGYLEDRLRNGLSPLPPGFPYLTSGVVVSHGEVDTNVHHGKSGTASFRIQHESPRKDHHWGTICQRVTGLTPHTNYVVRVSVKSKATVPDAVFVTADLTWGKNKTLPEGTYNWRQVEMVFNTEDRDYVELRFVAVAPALIWIDDVWLSEI